MAPYALNTPWSLPAALAIRFVRPWKVIRLGPIRSERIGHFVAEGAEQVVRIRMKQDSAKDWYYFETYGRGRTCNQQWERMLRRTLPMGHSRLRHVDFWNRRLPGHTRHHRPSTRHQARDIEGLFAQHDATLPFLAEEEREAKQWLRSKGWVDGEPFVCLHVRDSAFLTHEPLNGDSSESSAEAWAYHSYRDSDIATYVEAIRWLNQQGIWVLRMGRIMEKPTPYEDSRFIDYAFDDGQADLLDIWLFAHAHAVISTGSGPDNLAPVYRIPLLLIDYAPVSYLFSFCEGSITPRRLRKIGASKPLHFSEYFNYTFFCTEEYCNANLTFEALNSSEIVRKVKRFWFMFAGDSELVRTENQLDFWRSLNEFDCAGQLNNFVHPRAWIDEEWLAEGIINDR